MTRADALAVGGAFLPDMLESLVALRMAVWATTVWYRGLPLDTDPRTQMDAIWATRCMLGALDVIPFRCSLPATMETLAGVLKNRGARKDIPPFVPEAEHVRQALRRLYIVRLGMGLRLLPPGGYPFPPGGSPEEVGVPPVLLKEPVPCGS